MKNLFFAAAMLLLTAGLAYVAYAATTSATLSIQVVPATSIACDIGPNYTGSIPAGAQAAGFTHCAANYDFTTPTFANTATWLNCPSQAPSNALWFMTYSGGSGSPPCSDATIVTDPVTADQVLKVNFTLADYNLGIGLTELDTRNPHGTGGSGNTFPLGMYIDVNLRYDTTSFANTPGHSNGYNYGIWDFFWNDPTAGNNKFIEDDLSENGAPCCAPLLSTIGEWNAGCSGGRCFIGGGPAGNVSNVSGFSQTSYFTYGQRYTQNTSGNIAVCTYGNDIQLSSGYGGGAGCGTGNYVDGASDASINQRNNLIIWNPAGFPTGSSCNGSCAPTTDLTLYVKSVVVFACSSWQTTGCAIGTNSSAP